MAGFVTIKARRPTYRHGGGSLKATITAAGGRAAADVRAAVVEAATRVVNATVKAAGPGSNRAGWPIGPERPWEPGHVHSVLRFQVVDQSRGWYVRVHIANPADYAMFIHAPGDRGHIVWKREIARPLAAEIRKLRKEIPKIIKNKFEGR